MPDALGSVPLLSSLNPRELARVRRAARLVRAEGGSEIVTQGAPGDALFLLVRGAATVRRNGRRIATLGPGDYFGELALLDGGPRSATVLADGPAELLVLDRAGFATVLEEVPAVGRKLLVTMADRLRGADRKLVAP